MISYTKLLELYEYAVSNYKQQVFGRKLFVHF